MLIKFPIGFNFFAGGNCRHWLEKEPPRYAEIIERIVGWEIESLLTPSDAFLTRALSQSLSMPFYFKKRWLSPVFWLYVILTG